MSRGSADAANLHASAVEVGGRGLLILGPSGSGKSGLALRLMALGARLVADDRVLVTERCGRLVGAAPPALRGLVEARGVGILHAQVVEEAYLALAVDLGRTDAARMPQPCEIELCGVRIELISGRGAPNLEAALVQLLRCGRAR